VITALIVKIAVLWYASPFIFGR